MTIPNRIGYLTSTAISCLSFTSPRMLDYVVLDWDDTLNDTFIPLRRSVAAKGYPLPEEGVYLTTENTNGGLDVVLAEAEFMRERHVRKGNDKLTDVIRRLKRQGTQVGICTHRGYHKDAKELSEEAFATLDWTPDFTIILDPAVAGDKVAHLTEVFGEGRFTLIDDRPRWDAKHDLPENVWLMSQPWNADVKTHDWFTRVKDLEVLAIQLYHLSNMFCLPNYVTGEMKAVWNQDCEIRLARASKILPKDPRGDMEALVSFLKGKGITPEQYASTYNEVGSRMSTIPYDRRVVENVAAYKELLARLIVGLPIVPIHANDETEWGANGVAIRDERIVRRATDGGFELGWVEYNLSPDPYAIQWTETSTSIRWLGAGVPLVNTPLTTPVVYLNGEHVHRDPSDAQKWAEEKRLSLINKMHATGIDPTTQLKLPDEIMAIIRGGYSQGFPTPIVLATMQYVATYSEFIGEVKNWKELTDHYLKIYPMSSAHIRQYLPVEVKTVVSDEKRVQFIEVRSGVYIVNTALGHDDAIAEWAAAHWLEARPVPTASRVYPSILMLSQTSPKSYNAVSVPLGEITEAIKIVGLN